MIYLDDFEIESLELENEILTMRISIPWGELWDIDEYIVTFRFMGCQNFSCTYYVRTSTELVSWEKGVYYPNEKKVTTNLQVIEKMELDIQNHDFVKPNHFSLNCNSATSHGNKIGQIDFAQINLTTTNYQIFDADGNQISLNKMKSWSKDWWDSIDEMHKQNRIKQQKNH